MNRMGSVFYNSIDTLNSNLFSENPGNITTLHGLITGGQLIEPNFSTPDENDIQNSLLLAIYSIFIPLTWQLSPVAVNPFVLSTGTACGSVRPSSVSAYLSDAGTVFVCGNENMQYFLVGCIKPSICSGPPPSTNSVNQPEGNDTIHGIVPPPEYSCAGAFDLYRVATSRLVQRSRSKALRETTSSRREFSSGLWVNSY
ncbi:hypothetical protein TCE0_044f17418 [Talaromyces pinophilus]|uniref:Uncharacterized protein n=1 Tax=Talaromyces pinophilus TaxID=128442 RepID=A0A478ECF8_TALPI|nr:hypothetical protein TCE0_044f17418 [Talaromyces pinophilus]